jgi:putative inorganic carbon (HCO3(-)) transporter
MELGRDRSIRTSEATRGRWSWLAAGLVLAVAAGALALLAWFGAGSASHTYLKLVGLAGTLGLAAYLVWNIHPAFTLSLAVLLSPIASHWQQLGIPGALSPDRLLLIAGIGQVLLRAPAMRERRALRLHPSHVILALAALYALSSAFISHTLFTNAGSAGIIDAFGILPFLAFATAPSVFGTRRARDVLLTALVVLGAYLSLTVVFEIAHVNALVFPRYILDPNYGIHFGRGRGPFVDAVASGFACFTCAVGCAVALLTWSRRRARMAAAAVGVLCFAGAFLSLERSVWIGVIAATVVTMMVASRLRRHLLPVTLLISLVVIGPLALSSSLRDRVLARYNQVGPVWDRENLSVAALNMIAARPLSGFGWNRFQATSADYFRQSENYPLTATTASIHNYVLLYAVELGLPGVTLWVVGLALGVGSAWLTRGPPELEPWRIGLIAIFLMFIVVSNSVPPTMFQNLALWLWAGIVFAGRYASQATEAVVAARSAVVPAQPFAPSASATGAPAMR